MNGYQQMWSWLSPVLAWVIWHIIDMFHKLSRMTFGNGRYAMGIGTQSSWQCRWSIWDNAIRVWIHTTEWDVSESMSWVAHFHLFGIKKVMTWMKPCIEARYASMIMNLWTHWGRATHICVGNLTIIGADNGFSPYRRQDIIWTNAFEPWEHTEGKLINQCVKRSQIVSMEVSRM